jgi:NADH:ubiquinone oxidoreductase subunit H
MLMHYSCGFLSAAECLVTLRVQGYKPGLVLASRSARLVWSCGPYIYIYMCVCVCVVNFSMRIFITACALTILAILIRGTLPRYRVDQALTLH